MSETATTETTSHELRIHFNSEVNTIKLYAKSATANSQRQVSGLCIWVGAIKHDSNNFQFKRVIWQSNADLNVWLSFVNNYRYLEKLTATISNTAKTPQKLKKEGAHARTHTRGKITWKFKAHLFHAVCFQSQLYIVTVQVAHSLCQLMRTDLQVEPRTQNLSQITSNEYKKFGRLTKWIVKYYS